ncbi:MAG TPA: Hsp20/alpha crystallin family protein, partial [Bacilli bacterium]
MNRDLPESVWHRLREQTETVLGEDFWEELSVLLPIMSPRIDAYVAEKTLTVVVELPGLANPEGLELRLKKNILTLQGKIPCDYPAKEEDFFQKERYFGQFKRIL